MKSGDWRAVLSFYDAPRRYHEPLLVWVRPSSAMLQFIEDQGKNSVPSERTLTYFLPGLPPALSGRF